MPPVSAIFYVHCPASILALFALRPAPDLSLALVCVLGEGILTGRLHFPGPTVTRFASGLHWPEARTGDWRGERGGQGVSPRCPLPWVMSSPIQASSSRLQRPPDGLCRGPCPHQPDLPRTLGTPAPPSIGGTRRRCPRKPLVALFIAF